jgi:hypothetical protein
MRGVESLGKLPEEMQGATFGRKKPEVEIWIETYGPNVITRAVWRWVDKRDMPVEGLTKKPRWYAFLEEGLPHIQAVIEETKKKIIENDPEAKAAIEANIRKYIEEENQRREDRKKRFPKPLPQEQVGADPEAYLPVDQYLGEMQAKEDFRNSPEGKAKLHAINEDLTKRILAAEVARWAAPAPLKSEMSAEDFMNQD